MFSTNQTPKCDFCPTSVAFDREFRIYYLTKFIMDSVHNNQNSPSQSVAELAELEESGLRWYIVCSTGCISPLTELTVGYKLRIRDWCDSVLAGSLMGAGGDGVKAASLSPPPLFPILRRLGLWGTDWKNCKLRVNFCKTNNHHVVIHAYVILVPSHW